MARFSSPGGLSSRSAVAENPRVFSVLSEIYEIRLERTEHQFRLADKGFRDS
jgi:hypothetical protein